MSLRRLIFDDIWLKLFSLGAALVVWTAVNSAVQRDIEVAAPPLSHVASRTFYGVPVSVLAGASQPGKFQLHPSHVDVLVRGDQRSLEQLDERDVHVVLDLTKVTPDANLRRRLAVSAPPGLTLNIRVTPNEVEVVFPNSPPVSP